MDRILLSPSLLNLTALIDDAKCYELIRQHRWPDGARCPFCSGVSVVRHGRDETQRDRQRYLCKACNRRFDDLTGTILAGHHQPLRVWVLCLYFMGLNLSNQQIARELGLNESDAQMMTTQLVRRGLAGVQLVISDAREGIKAAVTKTLHATWQRCRVHTMRNAMAHAGKSQKRVVAAFMATAFAQEDADAAKAQWRQVADQLRSKMPKLATFMDQAEADVLAFMTFPKEHRVKIHSTNSLERLNGEVKRRTDVVGIFPNEPAILRLVGAILLEQNDEWATQRTRYMPLATFAPFSDEATVTLPTETA